MSRQWRRAPSATLCGYCSQRTIERGEPAIYIKISHAIKREMIRCQTCAGEAPPELPELLESGAIETSGFMPIGRAMPKRTRGGLKAAIAKEWTPYRESGEEG